MKIKELMKKPVVVERDLSLFDAARLMNKYSINSLPVINDGKIIGLVTHHDLVKHFGEQKKVSEIMNKQMICLKENDKVQSAIELVREKGIGIFPVLNSSGKIVGILDSKDILKAWDNEDYLIE